MRGPLPVLFLLGMCVAALPVAPPVAAQPQPPNRFFGTVTLNGVTPPVNTPVLAFIAGRLCGTGRVLADGRYVVDVEDESMTAGCGRPGVTITFQVGGVPAAQTGTYQRGRFTELNLTAPPPPGPRRYVEAFLDLADPRPCMPAPCDAERAALWNGDAAAWAAQGVMDADERFGRVIVMRVEAGEPAVIGNIARILGQPYLQITRLRFVGARAAQADEFVEITNLGGGDQDMAFWTVRSPLRDRTARFPDGFVLNPGQTCRIYTDLVAADSCGDARFGGADVWPDDAGVAVLLFYDLVAAERRYSADPNNQPPPPNLVGVE
jgi:hypothetical protein